MAKEAGSFWFSPNVRQQKIKGWLLLIVFACFFIDEITKIAAGTQDWSNYAWMIFYLFGLMVGIIQVRTAFKKEEAGTQGPSRQC